MPSLVARDYDLDLRLERKRLQRLKAAGLCVRCGRQAREGRRMCMGCALAEARRKNEAYHAQKGARKSA
jgi:hypothetical protein